MEQSTFKEKADGILVAGCSLALIVFLYASFIVN